MLLTMLKCKIHRATVTGTDLNYAGSITIDEELMRLADILPHEQVHVLNLANGARFETYAIPGPAGSGVVQVNGAAARLAAPGDKVIVLAYVLLPDREARAFVPRIVQVDEENHPTSQF
ncbi:MAG: Aspartate 1-decarboxylase [Clostridia bacterium 62_21]|nr:MAG: Aspartate 1-decarboxylase [Clostridia bacterium 62_21]HAG07040.1 aspartate 1-decarboxylase [Peptococcaceae bacterium]